MQAEATIRTVEVPAAEKFVKYIDVFKAWENKEVFVF